MQTSRYGRYGMMAKILDQTLKKRSQIVVSQINVSFSEIS